MQFKALPILLLSVTALAAPEPENKRGLLDELSSLTVDIPTDILSIATGLATNVLSDIGTLSNLGAGVTLPPPEIISVLATAVPTSLVSSILNDPQWGSSFASSIAAGKTPDWYAALPSSVKNYISSQAVLGASITGAGSLTGGSARPTGAAATGGSGSKSTNLAARPTGAIVASLAGAVGVLGLAIAL